jgi:hypothetical protein
LAFAYVLESTRRRGAHQLCQIQQKFEKFRPAAERGKALGDDLGAVAGTSLDKGVELARWRRRTSQSDQAASSMAMA